MKRTLSIIAVLAIAIMPLQAQEIDSSFILWSTMTMDYEHPTREQMHEFMRLYNIDQEYASYLNKGKPNSFSEMMPILKKVLENDDKKPPKLSGKQQNVWEEHYGQYFTAARNWNNVYFQSEKQKRMNDFCNKVIDNYEEAWTQLPQIKVFNTVFELAKQDIYDTVAYNWLHQYMSDSAIIERFAHPEHFNKLASPKVDLKVWTLSLVWWLKENLIGCTEEDYGYSAMAVNIVRDMNIASKEQSGAQSMLYDHQLALSEYYLSTYGKDASTDEIMQTKRELERRLETAADGHVGEVEHMLRRYCPVENTWRLNALFAKDAALPQYIRRTKTIFDSLNSVNREGMIRVEDVELSWLGLTSAGVNAMRAENQLMGRPSSFQHRQPYVATFPYRTIDSRLVEDGEVRWTKTAKQYDNAKGDNYREWTGTVTIVLTVKNGKATSVTYSGHLQHWTLNTDKYQTLLALANSKPFVDKNLTVKTHSMMQQISQQQISLTTWRIWATAPREHPRGCLWRV